MRTLLSWLSGGLMLGIVLACSKEPVLTPARAPVSASSQASAELFPIGRHRARGTVRFAATDKGLSMRGQITGLPNGNYGLSIHEKGDCSAHDGKSVGGFFNPGDAAEAPAGLLEDLNSTAGEVAKLKRVDERLSLDGASSVVGKAIVVHAWPYDANVDPKTVPFVACGVIRAE